MAPNSAFAVLMRSPWWVSVAIALGLFAVSQALLPTTLRTAGAAAALPFVVLAAIAGSRQWRAPSARQVEQTAKAVKTMAWPEFSQALAQGFAGQGHVVEPLTGPADFLLSRGGRTTVVSARRWKAARHGAEHLQALVEAARARGASGRVYVALGELSPQALRLAKAEGVEVLQADGIAQLLRGVPLPS